MKIWMKGAGAALVTLSSLGVLTATSQAALGDVVASVPALPHISPANSSQHSLRFEQASTDEISEAIEALSRQAQLKEDALAKLAIELEQRHEQFEDTQQAAIYTRQGILAALPVDSYRVSSSFGHRQIFGKAQFHKGIDLAAPLGAPVYATGPGVVTLAGWVGGYGQLVEINHGAGLVSRYGHNSRLHVRVGDRVGVRQRIADVGCTGRCTGPHVHYEVIKNGQQIDPSIHLAMANR